MRVEVLTDRPAERFTRGTRLYPEGSSAPLTIVEARPAHPGWVLHFGEVPTRAAAEVYRSTYLEIEAPPGDGLGPAQYRWHEMVGVAVHDLEGAELGTVRGIYRAGGADVLEVVGGPRGDFDLPIARPFMRLLAPRRGEIVADPVSLDLPPSGSIPPPPPPRPPRPRRATRRHPAVPAPPPRAGGAEPESAEDHAGGDAS